ncbi:2',5'-phosphodiesterase [Achlya hypogyna]|uniref:2',5'-phosphodiesterase n=1 Tax=Achlya hypogyna TaxID=1202772 RepID=A0A1V9ZRG1_ACHHY|nr:2',5'-phosphodiesterase [Achlya hypogyna]
MSTGTAPQAPLVAHVRHQPGGDSITLKFSLLGSDRQLVRQPTEELSRILVRIDRLLHPPSTKKIPKQGKKVKAKTVHQQLGKSTTTIQFRNGANELLSPTLSLGDALPRAATLQIQEDIYNIVVNEPALLSLSLHAHTLMTGIPLLPTVELEFCTPADCSWIWTRVANGTEPVVVGSTAVYTPSASDIGASLCVTVTAPTGATLSSLSTTAVTAQPDRSVFAPRHAYAATRSMDHLEGFRFMTYNILYAKYARAERTYNRMYPHAKPGILFDHYRMPLVALEMLEAGADIICAQEMGEAICQSYYLPLLQGHGFDGEYAGKAGTTPEGLAIFYKTEVWALTESHVLVFADAVADVPPTSPLGLFLAAHPQVALAVRSVPSVGHIALLRSKAAPTQALLVANTHLFYRYDADAVRLVQTVLLTRFLEAKKTALEAATGLRIGVVITGDLNALPEAIAAQFLTTGAVDTNHRHWAAASAFEWSPDQSSNEAVPWPADAPQKLVHSLALASACGQPEFTHFVKNHEFTFIGTLDHILVDTSALAPAGHFPFFSLEAASHETSLPSTTFPSDHVSLVADVRFV